MSISSSIIHKVYLHLRKLTQLTTELHRPKTQTISSKTKWNQHQVKQKLGRTKFESKVKLGCLNERSEQRGVFMLESLKSVLKVWTAAFFTCKPAALTKLWKLPGATTREETVDQWVWGMKFRPFCVAQRARGSSGLPLYSLRPTTWAED